MSLFDSLPSIPQGIQDFGNQAASGATALVDKAVGFAKNFDPANVRMEVSQLLFGGASRKASTATTAPRFAGDMTDWRVKVKLGKEAKYFYAGPDAGILAPLSNTDGVIFPYTPQISVTHTARYGAQQLTHSNYTNYAYEGSEVAAISITGEFTAQNSTEAAYVLACIHFFRTASKMWFGGNSGLTGNPPPMLFLTGYGANYFPNVPCVLTSFQHTMPQDVDYVQAITSVQASVAAPIPVANVKPGESLIAQGQATPSKSSVVTKSQSTMVPTMSQIQITLQPIYSRKNIYDNFNLNDFAKGSLLGDKKSGGFI